MPYINEKYGKPVLAKTRQQLFDISSVFILKQGQRSIDNAIRGTCMYRGLKGRKCGIGCLIPNRQYLEDMEALPLSDLFEQFPEQMYKSGLSPKHSTFLNNLQAVHDNNLVADWPFMLKNFAEQYQLVTNKMSKITVKKASRTRHKQHIQTLGLPVRAYNSLMQRTDVRTIGQLTQCTVEQLRNLREIGRMTLRSMRECLYSQGLYLKGE